MSTYKPAAMSNAPMICKTFMTVPLFFDSLRMLVQSSDCIRVAATAGGRRRISSRSSDDGDLDQQHDQREVNGVEADVQRVGPDPVSRRQESMRLVESLLITG